MSIHLAETFAPLGTASDGWKSTGKHRGTQRSPARQCHPPQSPVLFFESLVSAGQCLPPSPKHLQLRVVVRRLRSGTVRVGFIKLRLHSAKRSVAPRWTSPSVFGLPGKACKIIPAKCMVPSEGVNQGRFHPRQHPQLPYLVLRTSYLKNKTQSKLKPVALPFPGSQQLPVPAKLVIRLEHNVSPWVEIQANGQGF
jgi:hypothetical protein